MGPPRLVPALLPPHRADQLVPASARAATERDERRVRCNECSTEVGKVAGSSLAPG